MTKEECCVCFEEKRLINIKCKHPLCNDCYKKLINNLCPLCRQNIILIKSKFKILLNSSIEVILFCLLMAFISFTDDNFSFILNTNYGSSNRNFYGRMIEREMERERKETSTIELFFCTVHIILDVINLIKT